MRRAGPARMLLHRPVFLSAELAARLEAATQPSSMGSDDVIEDVLVDRARALRALQPASSTSRSSSSTPSSPTPCPPTSSSSRSSTTPCVCCCPRNHPLAARPSIRSPISQETWIRAHHGSAARLTDHVLGKPASRRRSSTRAMATNLSKHSVRRRGPRHHARAPPQRPAQPRVVRLCRSPATPRSDTFRPPSCAGSTPRPPARSSTRCARSAPSAPRRPPRNQVARQARAGGASSPIRRGPDRPPRRRFECALTYIMSHRTRGTAA